MLSQLCGNLAAGIMLSQALYWSGVTDDPEGWFYKSATDWQRETTITRAQQQHARAILCNTPFWKEKLKGQPATLRYRIDFEQLRQAVIQFEQNQQSRFAKSANLDSAKQRNKKRRNAQTSLLESGDSYKEAEITSESTDRKQIPPTPLFKGGDANTSSTEVARARGQEIKTLLKRELQDVPLNSRNLSTEDYDRYFRDVRFVATITGPILVETDNRVITAEGLSKYGARLKKLGKRVLGRDVEFQIADEGQ